MKFYSENVNELLELLITYENEPLAILRCLTELERNVLHSPKKLRSYLRERSILKQIQDIMLLYTTNTTILDACLRFLISLIDYPNVHKSDIQSDLIDIGCLQVVITSLLDAEIDMKYFTTACTLLQMLCFDAPFQAHGTLIISLFNISKYFKI